MDRTRFLQLIDDLLELPPGTLQGPERLSELPGWDSLAVIGFIALVDEQFSVVVEGRKLADARSIDHLLALVEERLAA